MWVICYSQRSSLSVTQVTVVVIIPFQEILFIYLHLDCQCDAHSVDSGILHVISTSALQRVGHKDCQRVFCNFVWDSLQCLEWYVLDLFNYYFHYLISSFLLNPFNYSGYYETFLKDEQAVSILNLENAEFCCNYTDNFERISDQTNISRMMMHCCLDSKINISEAINFSNETISTCQEEFPPLYR